MGIKRIILWTKDRKIIFYPEKYRKHHRLWKSMKESRR
jgi:hypothetical protein